MEVIPVVREFIANEILQDGGLTLSDDTPLIEGGHVTSLQAVELVMFLEEQFRVEIDPEEVNEENFRSLATISHLIASKLG